MPEERHDSRPWVASQGPPQHQPIPEGEEDWTRRQIGVQRQEWATPWMGLPVPRSKASWRERPVAPAAITAAVTRQCFPEHIPAQAAGP